LPRPRPRAPTSRTRGYVTGTARRPDSEPPPATAGPDQQPAAGWVGAPRPARGRWWTRAVAARLGEGLTSVDHLGRHAGRRRTDQRQVSGADRGRTRHGPPVRRGSPAGRPGIPEGGLPRPSAAPTTSAWSPGPRRRRIPGVRLLAHPGRLLPNSSRWPNSQTGWPPTPANSTSTSPTNGYPKRTADG